ncbi:MAG: hypothetical protein IKH45_09105 [Neisseriaceae bacterium]|nr:hypothetical protein [Neisseriaceae bacterium]
MNDYAFSGSLKPLQNWHLWHISSFCLRSQTNPNYLLCLRLLCYYALKCTHIYQVLQRFQSEKFINVKIRPFSGSLKF